MGRSHYRRNRSARRHGAKSSRVARKGCQLTSRTKCAFPMPPIDGLQLITPTVSRLCVTSATLAPTRAAAAAASAPAWPPPMTITSNDNKDDSLLCTHRRNVKERHDCGTRLDKQRRNIGCVVGSAVCLYFISFPSLRSLTNTQQIESKQSPGEKQ